MANQIIHSSALFPLLIGFIPSILWLWFWLYIDKQHRKPLDTLVACFLVGGATVLVATVLERGLAHFFVTTDSQVIVWAAVEELLKFFVFYIVAYRHTDNKEKVDPAMYIIVVALGFAAVENILYTLQPSLIGHGTAIVLTGGLRFFGATLLHVICSCIIGIMVGITSKKFRSIGILAGITGAIFLHATFNFFIIKNDTASLLQIYGYLWIAAIISHIILEKLRRIPIPVEALNQS